MINNIKYRILVFTNTGKLLSFKIQTPTTQGVFVNMCLIGGGGGGARGTVLGSTSGAGAGNLIFMNNLLLPSSDYTVYIGRGGKGANGTGNYVNGQKGEDSYVKNTFSNLGNFTNYVAAGGAGAVASSTVSNGQDGTTKSFVYYPAYKVGETSSSGSGGVGSSTAIENIGKGGTSGPNISFSEANEPYEGKTPIIWSYGNKGGNSSRPSISGQTNAGGGGGAYTSGDNGILDIGNSEANGNGGAGGKGFTIYYADDKGQEVCGGSAGTGFNALPPTKTYGAGTSAYSGDLNPADKNALDNSGSAGGSVIGDASIAAGNGGSGIFMIRYRI